LQLYDAFVKFGLVENNVKSASEEEGLLQAAEDESISESGEYELSSESFDAQDFIKLQTDKNPLKITSMTWTTPLGFPIVQPYRKLGKHQVKTFMQTFSVVENTSTNPVNSMKQASAFPPNFVHSLDACHMMITSVAAKEQGLTFAAVHDSYWTHAGDIEKMNKLLREAFIQLHSRKIMQNLRQELLSRFEDHRILVKVSIDKEKKANYIKAMESLGLKPNQRKKTVDLWVPVVPSPLPETGSFDIQEVRNSKYFFH
jgi:DNA-directed RNA polymerase, mitochondrial